MEAAPPEEAPAPGALAGAPADTGEPAFFVEDEPASRALKSTLPSAPTPGPPAISSTTLAELYFQQGAFAEAIAVYEELLAGDPTNHRARGRVDEIRTASLSATQAIVAEAVASAPRASPPGAASAPLPPAPHDPRHARRQALARSIARLERFLAAVKEGKETRVRVH